MLIALTVIRLSLALVFGTAGVTKLLDLKGTQSSLDSFGLAKGLIPWVSILLPVAELGICVALLFGVTAWGASLAALLLLCVFCAVIGVNLSRGQTPDCHCFGHLYSQPLGRGTLIRNGFFALLSLVLVFQGQSGAGLNVWSLPSNSLQFALAGFAVVVLVAVAWLYIDKKRESKRLPETVASRGLPLESVAPAFELKGFSENGGSLRALLGYEKPVMLLFANPKCGPCAALFQEVGQWQQAHAAQVTIAVISQGTLKDNFVNTARNDLRNVFVQSEREIAELYEARLTPSAVLIRPDGLIGSKVVAGADEIRSLLHNTIHPTG